MITRLSSRGPGAFPSLPFWTGATHFSSCWALRVESCLRELPCPAQAHAPLEGSRLRAYLASLKGRAGFRLLETG